MVRSGHSAWAMLFCGLLLEASVHSVCHLDSRHTSLCAYDDTMVNVQLNSAHVLDETGKGHLVATDSQIELELNETSLLLQIGEPAAEEFKPPAKPLHDAWLSHLASRIGEHTRSLLRHQLNWLHRRKASLLQSHLKRGDAESVLLVPLALGSVLVALSLLLCVFAGTREHSHGSWNEACHPSQFAPRAVGSQRGRKRDSRPSARDSLPSASPSQFGERLASSAAVPARAAPTTTLLRSGRMLAETKPQLCLKAPGAEVSDHAARFRQAEDSPEYLPSARSSVGGAGAWVHVEYVVPQDSECCLYLPSLRGAVPGRGYGATGGFNEEVLFKVGVKAEAGKETLYAWNTVGEVLARSVPQHGGGGWRYAIVDAQGRSHGVVRQDDQADNHDGSSHRFLLSEAIDPNRSRMVLRGDLQSEMAMYDLGGSLMAHFLAPGNGADAYRAYLPQGADVCLIILFILSTERLTYVSS